MIAEAIKKLSKNKKELIKHIIWKKNKTNDFTKIQQYEEELKFQARKGLEQIYQEEETFDIKMPKGDIFWSEVESILN